MDTSSTFPHLKKRDVRLCVAPGSLELRDSPLSHHSDNVSRDTLELTIQALKELRRVVLPVYADLQFRLAWKLLPTRSRLWFLQRLSEDALNCNYSGCTSTETERHLFFECPQAGALWRFIGDDWRSFSEAISWELVCIPTEPQWTTRARPHYQALGAFWMILRSVALHVIWTTRNKHHFESQPPLDADKAIYQVYSIFGAHFRALSRSSDYGSRRRFRRSLRQSPPTTRLHHFVVTHPKLFDFRQPALLLDATGTLCAPPVAD